MKFKKALILFREAHFDLENGCYNKAVSAAYFSVRLMAEVLLQDVKTTKDDKIANAIGRILGEGIKNDILWLYEERKKADHRPFLFDRERAQAVIEKASRILEIMKNEISRRGLCSFRSDKEESDPRSPLGPAFP